MGLLTVDFKNQYYLEIVNYVEKIAREKGYSIIVMNSERSSILEKKHIIELQKRGVDGIVAVSYTHLIFSFSFILFETYNTILIYYI